MTSKVLLHAFKWSMASEIASKAIQPLVFIVLARLLTPEDFGVMSAALMVIGFSQIFWEAGMGKALIQRQTDIEGAANAAFWINICLGGVIAAILYLTAGSVARTFFQDERVTVVLQVMTLQIFLGALSAVHIALLQKEMGFKRLFWVRFATVSLPGLASIPLAWYGMDYWALVVGTLVGQALQVAMLWRLSHWRPSWSFNTSVAKEMARFGTWVGASGLLTWFYIWADSLIVGMYLGSHELGLYRTGNQFVAMVFAFVFGPIIPVLYSHFSKMNCDKRRLSHALKNTVEVFTVLALPVAFLLYCLSETISTWLFGEKWHGIALVIGIMALTYGFSYLVSANGEAYRALNKPNYETLVMGLPIPIYLFGYILSVKNGLEAFLLARFLIMAIGLIVQIWLVAIIMQIPLAVLFVSIFIGAALSSSTIIIAHVFDINVASSFLTVLGYMLTVLSAISIAIYFAFRNGFFKGVSQLLLKSNTRANVYRNLH